MLKEKAEEKGLEAPSQKKQIKPNAYLWRRGYPSVFKLTSKNNSVPRISRIELKAMLDANQPVVLIDLRDFDLGEPMLPTAFKIAIPRTKEEQSLFPKDRALTKENQLILFKEALKLSDEQFQKSFKFSHPRKDQQLIFYSSTGVRSDTITVAAMSMGYNAKSLLGGSRLWNKYYGPDEGLPIPLSKKSMLSSSSTDSSPPVEELSKSNPPSSPSIEKKSSRPNPTSSTLR